jgi:hypothetical protein
LDESLARGTYTTLQGALNDLMLAPIRSSRFGAHMAVERQREIFSGLAHDPQIWQVGSSLRPVRGRGFEESHTMRETRTARAVSFLAEHAEHAARSPPPTPKRLAIDEINLCAPPCPRAPRTLVLSLDLHRPA